MGDTRERSRSGARGADGADAAGNVGVGGIGGRRFPAAGPSGWAPFLERVKADSLSPPRGVKFAEGLADSPRGDGARGGGTSGGEQTAAKQPLVRDLEDGGSGNALDGGISAVQSWIQDSAAAMESESEDQGREGRDPGDCYESPFSFGQCRGVEEEEEQGVQEPRPFGMAMISHAAGDASRGMIPPPPSDSPECGLKPDRGNAGPMSSGDESRSQSSSPPHARGGARSASPAVGASSAAIAAPPNAQQHLLSAMEQEAMHFEGLAEDRGVPLAVRALAVLKLSGVPLPALNDTGRSPTVSPRRRSSPRLRAIGGREQGQVDSGVSGLWDVNADRHWLHSSIPILHSGVKASLQAAAARSSTLAPLTADADLDPDPGRMLSSQPAAMGDSASEFGLPNDITMQNHNAMMLDQDLDPILEHEDHQNGPFVTMPPIWGGPPLSRDTWTATSQTPPGAARPWCVSIHWG